MTEGIIETTSSAWSFRVVLVGKKDGRLRFCLDYQKWNDMTKKDYYPLLRVDNTLVMLFAVQWFLTLILKSGYWQQNEHSSG